MLAEPLLQGFLELGTERTNLAGELLVLRILGGIWVLTVDDVFLLNECIIFLFTPVSILSGFVSTVTTSISSSETE